MNFQERYSRALHYASLKHKGQDLRGTELPYLVHVVGVSMEVILAGNATEKFDTAFAAEVALLHDVMEDTNTPYQELEEKFGARVATAIMALTKFPNQEKEKQIPDSLRRIKLLEKEVWAVKLADRITNLQAPPVDWDYKKRKNYLADAMMILEELKDGNDYLASRLQSKIIEYQSFVITGDK